MKSKVNFFDCFLNVKPKVISIPHSLLPMSKSHPFSATDTGEFSPYKKLTFDNFFFLHFVQSTQFFFLHLNSLLFSFSIFFDVGSIKFFDRLFTSYVRDFIMVGKKQQRNAVSCETKRLNFMLKKIFFFFLTSRKWLQ